FSLNYHFRGSINNATDKITFRDNFAGITTDASVRFTTAGVQLGASGQYSFVRTRHQEFLVSLGAFGRYQSASNGSDGYQIYYPNRTNVPAVLIGYQNRTPQKTYAIGGLFQFAYNYTFNQNFLIGFAPGLQTDTNGDMIIQGVLRVGKRF
ncbi:MAG: hypothetical protein M3Q06_07180, partial [Bacteroidota bacterium]|nr:hypothetical protein [Bacteroidota bacterium]